MARSGRPDFAEILNALCGNWRGELRRAVRSFGVASSALQRPPVRRTHLSNREIVYPSFCALQFPTPVVIRSAMRFAVLPVMIALLSGSCDRMITPRHAQQLKDAESKAT